MEYDKEFCGICKQELNNPDDPTTKDCGGDCLRCMAEFAKDPDCEIELDAIRKGGRKLEGDND